MVILLVAPIVCGVSCLVMVLWCGPLGPLQFDSRLFCVCIRVCLLIALISILFTLQFIAILFVKFATPTSVSTAGYTILCIKFKDIVLCE